VADQRAGNGADSTANDSTLCGIPCHGSSYSRATQAANHRALLRTRAGAKRHCQYRQDNSVLHCHSSQTGFSPRRHVSNSQLGDFDPKAEASGGGLPSCVAAGSLLKKRRNRHPLSRD
jgi:hypothetical protein